MSKSLSFGLLLLFLTHFVVVFCDRASLQAELEKLKEKEASLIDKLIRIEDKLESLGSPVPNKIPRPEVVHDSIPTISTEVLN